MAVDKIVVDHRPITTLYQELDRVTTDITCPACYQHGHEHFLSLACALFPLPGRGSYMESFPPYATGIGSNLYASSSIPSMHLWFHSVLICETPEYTGVCLCWRG